MYGIMVSQVPEFKVMWRNKRFSLLHRLIKHVNPLVEHVLKHLWDAPSSGLAKQFLDDFALLQDQKGPLPGESLLAYETFLKKWYWHSYSYGSNRRRSTESPASDRTVHCTLRQFLDSFTFNYGFCIQTVCWAMVERML